MSSVPKLSHYISKFALCLLWKKKVLLSFAEHFSRALKVKTWRTFLCSLLQKVTICSDWILLRRLLWVLNWLNCFVIWCVCSCLCTCVCVFFSGAVTMPWFSDFRCWFTQRNRRPIPQIWILSSGLLCSHGGCKFKSPSQNKKMSRFLFLFFLYTSAQQFKRTQSSSSNKSKEPECDSFLPKEANEIYFLVLFIQLDPCMKHD